MNNSTTVVSASGEGFFEMYSTGCLMTGETTGGRVLCPDSLLCSQTGPHTLFPYSAFLLTTVVAGELFNYYQYVSNEAPPCYCRTSCLGPAVVSPACALCPDRQPAAPQTTARLGG